MGPVLNLVQIKNGDLILSGYFTKNVFETSPDAVVTVSIAKPLRPPLGTVAEILLSLSILNVAAWPGPKEILRRQPLFPKLVPGNKKMYRKQENVPGVFSWARLSPDAFGDRGGLILSSPSE